VNESVFRSGRLARKGSPLVCLLSLLTAASAGADQRADFLAAESTLEQGDRQTFEGILERLGDYPLYPYLRFAALKRDLGQAASKEVERFLEEHGDTPLAERLRRVWLKRLAGDAAWGDYVRLYRSDESVERRCHYLQGLIATGRDAEALPRIEPLWLTGRSLPAACDPVLEAWREAGELTPERAWARIALAMDADRIGLARYLGRFLPEDEPVWLERWLALRDDPEQVLKLGAYAEHHSQLGRILAYGIGRLARTDPQRASEALRQLEQVSDLTPELAADAAARVGFALAARGDASGLRHLDRLSAGAENLPQQERRLRAALTFGDWSRVAAWVAAMPPGPLKSEHWLYWEARAESALGNEETALLLYGEAARERSLWGFLAAEHAGLPYRLGHRPVPVDAERLGRIALGSAARRIGELSALGRRLDVRREWRHLIADLDREDLQAAAVLAQRWGWPDQAIFTLAKSDWWDDLELRFPLLYRQEVADQARLQGLDPSWIYAVLRQESAFDPHAESHAGALGLMQLLPATARSVARSLNQPRPSRADLLSPRRNIQLGSAYLAEMHRRFDDHPALAAAAYNAGPHRVETWLPAQSLAADLWVATIPFEETRGYVRRVLAYRVIYDQRMGRTREPLSRLMRPIAPAGEGEESDPEEGAARDLGPLSGPQD